MRFYNQSPGHPVVYFLGFVLLLFALLINLGKASLFFGVDEATRVLVSLEMIINENFITPTVNGEFYYNKPPLYNWLIVSFIKLFGQSEFILRLPAIISFVTMGIAIYFFVQKSLGKTMGLAVAFAFYTTGRLMFWISFYTYIDFTFSLFVYMGILSIYYFLEKEEYYKLFIISWIFTSVAFMLKGFPAIVFQILSLFIWLYLNKKLKKIWGIPSITGFFIFIIIIGTYFSIYFQYSSIENLLRTLFTESAQRTPIFFSVKSVLMQVFIFPKEFLFHFLPWSILVFLLFIKKLRKQIWDNKFLKFNLSVFMINIIPYWISPDVYPKYIIMLLPLLLTVCIYLFQQYAKLGNPFYTKITKILMAFSLVLIVGYMTLIFIREFDFVNLILLKISILCILTFSIFYLLKTSSINRIILFSIVIIIARIAFDWFILPKRAENYIDYKKDALSIAEIIGDEPISYYKTTITQYGVSVYISLKNNIIVGSENDIPIINQFYLVDDVILDELESQAYAIEKHFRYPNVQDDRFINLIKILP